MSEEEGSRRAVLSLSSCVVVTCTTFALLVSPASASRGALNLRNRTAQPRPRLEPRPIRSTSYSLAFSPCGPSANTLMCSIASSLRRGKILACCAALADEALPCATRAAMPCVMTASCETTRPSQLERLRAKERERGTHPEERKRDAALPRPPAPRDVALLLEVEVAHSARGGRAGVAANGREEVEAEVGAPGREEDRGRRDRERRGGEVPARGRPRASVLLLDRGRPDVDEEFKLSPLVTHELERAEGDAPQARQVACRALARRDVERLQQVGEVRERVPERRELPVDDTDDARLCRVEDLQEGERG